MGQNVEDEGDIMHGANMQIDDKIRKSVARTVDLMKRRKNLNDEIKEEREQIEKLGVHPRAYQDEVRNFKLYDESERAAYMASRKRMQEVLQPVENDLFKDEIEDRKKKAERKAAKAGNQPRSQAELDEKTNTDPKSDPTAGGAGSATVGDQNPPTNPPGELDEGEAALAAAAPASLGKKSQSQISAEKLAAAKLAGPAN